MEQTRLDEIKTFIDAKDTPAIVGLLFAEVERLTTENSGLRANSMIQEHIIAGGRDPIRDAKIVKLIMENSDLKSERDTLQKAAEEDIRRLIFECADEPCDLCYEVCANYDGTCVKGVIAGFSDKCHGFGWCGIQARGKMQK